jgi:hypothetical protein
MKITTLSSCIILLLLFFSCSTAEKESAKNKEETSEEEGFEAYSQDKVVEVPGLRVSTTLTSSLNDRQKPMSSYDYLYSLQKSFYVFNRFYGIKKGGHEYQCNISTDSKKNAIVGKVYHFTVENDSYNAWTQFDSNTLYDGSKEKPLDGASIAILRYIWTDASSVKKK